MPLLTKAVYIYLGGKIDVIEFEAKTLDSAHTHLNVWQNGHQAQSTTVDFTELNEPRNAVVQAGFSFNNVAKCMTGSGIPQAEVMTIATACAVVCAFTAGFGCAVCASAAAGAWGGIVTRCVQRELKR